MQDKQMRHSTPTLAEPTPRVVESEVYLNPESICRNQKLVENVPKLVEPTKTLVMSSPCWPKPPSTCSNAPRIAVEPRPKQVKRTCTLD